MATIFNEDNTIEQMMLSTLQKNGWKYIQMCIRDSGKAVCPGRAA